jgi:Flp pilus assembly pilin Flp
MRAPSVFAVFSAGASISKEITQLPPSNSRPHLTRARIPQTATNNFNTATSTRINLMISIQKLRNLARDDRGLSTVEYVIILVLIAAVALGAWKQFGEDVQTKLDEANSSFNETVVVPE